MPPRRVVASEDPVVALERRRDELRVILLERRRDELREQLGLARESAPVPPLVAEETAALERRRDALRERLRRARDADARRRPFISEFTGLQLDAFVESLVEQLRTWPQYTKIARLLVSPDRLVRDVVCALRQPRTQHGRPTIVYNLQVNGDVQRGKSTLEACTALIVKLINDADACRDRCFSVLGTHMVPWAVDVSNKLKREVAALRVTLVAGRGEDHAAALRETLDEGGCVVFSRSKANLRDVARLVFDFTRNQQAGEMTVSAHYVILDEADRMRGTGVEGGQFLYEQQLAELCGAQPVPAPHRGEEAHGELDAPRRMRAACTVDVSATNGLSFFAMLQRLGAPDHALLDILSFQPDREYVGFERYERFHGRFLEGLAPANVYVNADVVDMYEEALRTDWACVLDCTTTRVNAGTPYNLQLHVEEVLARLARRPGIAARTMACVFVHGGNTTFPGRVGVCFWGAGAGAAVARLRRDVVDAGGADFTPLRLAGCPGREYITQIMIRPLLARLDASLAAANAAYTPLMRDTLSLEQLQLTLLLLRSTWRGLPVAVVGYGMVRRSLSIVAVDARAACQLAVTHVVQWAGEGANAADVTQQFLRACTTLHAFHAVHGFDRVRVLAPAHVWRTVLGAVTFNAWFASRFAADGAPLGRDATVAAFELVSAAVGRGMDLPAAIFRYLDMPESVRRYFSHRNALHPRAAVLKALTRDTVARYDAADAPMDVDGEEAGGGGSDGDDGGDGDGDDDDALAAFALRGPPIRRAHKAAAMAQLRAWLPADGALAEVDAVQTHFTAVLVAGLGAWALIDDVLAHSGAERLWGTHGVWVCRTPAGAHALASVRPDAPVWAPAAAPAAGAAADAPAGAAPAAHALFAAYLRAHQLEEVIPYLRSSLNITTKAQLLTLREGHVRQLDAAMRAAGQPGLLRTDRRVLLDIASDATAEQCARCLEVKALCVHSECDHVGMCAACTRELAPAAGGPAACPTCSLSSVVLEPPMEVCHICLERFTAREMLVLLCTHRFCVGCLVCQLRTAVAAPVNDPLRPPLNCSRCRVQVVDSGVLGPLVRMSRTFPLIDVESPPMRLVEFEQYTELAAQALGLLARCPREGCGRTDVLSREAARDPRHTCADCELVFCNDCRVPWHDGLTCAEQRRTIVDPAVLAERVVNLTERVPCPRCGRLWDGMTDACNHAYCDCSDQPFCALCFGLHTTGGQADYKACRLYRGDARSNVAASHVMKSLHIVNTLKLATLNCVRATLALQHVAAALGRLQVTVDFSRPAPFLVFSNIRRARIVLVNDPVTGVRTDERVEFFPDVYCTQAMIDHLAASFVSR